MENIAANVFNIQRFSLDDGDGIRTCVFLKGCPLRCKWCHNMESWDYNTEIAFYPEKCILCGACSDICSCHLAKNSEHSFYQSECTHCTRCAEICPANALEIVGKKMTVESVVDEVLRDAPFFGENGGVTITGGEPMSQFDFTLELAKQIKAAGYSVVIETSGYAHTDKFEKILPYCDCFYYDCKADSSLHACATGKDDVLIMHNLDFLLNNGAKVVLRCPIVPGGNLTSAYVDKIISIGKKYPNLTAISLLPYHKYGADKHRYIGKAKQDIYPEPSDALMTRLKSKIGCATAVKVYL